MWTKILRTTGKKFCAKMETEKSSYLFFANFWISIEEHDFISDATGLTLLLRNQVILFTLHCRNKDFWWKLILPAELSTKCLLIQCAEFWLINKIVYCLQIFRLNHIPMRLWYVSWEDSVWIESWHDRGGFFRTVQVIRSASKSMIHAMTHALPIHEEYDSVIPYISKV